MESSRRSQRLSAQASGLRSSQETEHASAQGRKRGFEESTALPEVTWKRCRLTERNLSMHQHDMKANSRADSLANDYSQQIETRTATDPIGTANNQRIGPILVESGVVFEESYTVAPYDQEMLLAALARPRPLPTSAHKHWKNMRELKIQMALNKLSLESKIIEAMLSPYDPPFMYERFRDDEWSEVGDELTDKIEVPRPSMVESYLWCKYPKACWSEFEDLVSTESRYAMPTFAMEAAVGDQVGQVVQQAAYNGAVMTRAAIAAEGQMGKDEASLYLKTKAITVTLSPDEICVYANHAIRDQSTGKVAYHHHCVERIRYLKSEDDWNKAYRVLRNAQLFGLHLADLRVHDIEVYFREKAQRIEQIKVKHGELQKEARAKTDFHMSSQVV